MIIFPPKWRANEQPGEGWAPTSYYTLNFVQKQFLVQKGIDVPMLLQKKGIFTDQYPPTILTVPKYDGSLVDDWHLESKEGSNGSSQVFLSPGKTIFKGNPKSLNFYFLVIWWGKFLTLVMAFSYSATPHCDDFCQLQFCLVQYQVHYPPGKQHTPLPRLLKDVPFPRGVYINDIILVSWRVRCSMSMLSI